MAYTRRNYRTKRAIKDALALGETVTVYQPGPFGSDVPGGITSSRETKGQTCPTCDVTDSRPLWGDHGNVMYGCYHCGREFYG